MSERVKMSLLALPILQKDIRFFFTLCYFVEGLEWFLDWLSLWWRLLISGSHTYLASLHKDITTVIIYFYFMKFMGDDPWGLFGFYTDKLELLEGCIIVGHFIESVGSIIFANWNSFDEVGCGLIYIAVISFHSSYALFQKLIIIVIIILFMQLQSSKLNLHPNYIFMKIIPHHFLHSSSSSFPNRKFKLKIIDLILLLFKL